MPTVARGTSLVGSLFSGLIAPRQPRLFSTATTSSSTAASAAAAAAAAEGHEMKEFGSSRQGGAEGPASEDTERAEDDGRGGVRGSSGKSQGDGVSSGGEGGEHLGPSPPTNSAVSRGAKAGEEAEGTAVGETRRSSSSGGGSSNSSSAVAGSGGGPAFDLFGSLGKALKTHARHLVSQNKRRYQADGFDLDMTYITENIIAMGFPAGDPSSGLLGMVEGFYRNHMEDVILFLEQHHEGKYKVYNLCEERLYDAALFQGKVACFPFEDHNCPPLQLLGLFCRSAHEWLRSSMDNVVVVHCKAGMGRTGIMIACLLLYENYFPGASEAIHYFNHKRCVDGRALVIPSQQRYVRYFEKILRTHAGVAPQPKRCILRGIRLHRCPYWIRPSVVVSNHSGVLFSSRTHPKTRDISPDDMWYPAQRKGVMLFALPGERCVTELCGDFKITFHERHGDFSCWLNTSMLDSHRQFLATKDLDHFEKRSLVSPGFIVEVVVIDANAPPPQPKKQQQQQQQQVSEQQQQTQQVVREPIGSSSASEQRGTESKDAAATETGAAAAAAATTAVEAAAKQGADLMEGPKQQSHPSSDERTSTDAQTVAAGGSVGPIVSESGGNSGTATAMASPAAVDSGGGPGVTTVGATPTNERQEATDNQKRAGAAAAAAAEETSAAAAAAAAATTTAAAATAGATASAAAASAQPAAAATATAPSQVGTAPKPNAAPSSEAQASRSTAAAPAVPTATRPKASAAAAKPTPAASRPTPAQSSLPFFRSSPAAAPPQAARTPASPAASPSGASSAFGFFAAMGSALMGQAASPARATTSRGRPSAVPEKKQPAGFSARDIQSFQSAAAAAAASPRVGLVAPSAARLDMAPVPIQPTAAAPAAAASAAVHAASSVKAAMPSAAAPAATAAAGAAAAEGGATKAAKHGAVLDDEPTLFFADAVGGLATASPTSSPARQRLAAAGVLSASPLAGGNTVAAAAAAAPGFTQGGTVQPGGANVEQQLSFGASLDQLSPFGGAGSKTGGEAAGSNDGAVAAPPVGPSVDFAIAAASAADASVFTFGDDDEDFEGFD